jgi:hypothetical protein
MEIKGTSRGFRCSFPVKTSLFGATPLPARSGVFRGRQILFLTPQPIMEHDMVMFERAQRGAARVAVECLGGGPWQTITGNSREHLREC